MFVLALLAVGCFWFCCAISWMFQLSGRCAINIGIWTFVASFAAFCFCK